MKILFIGTAFPPVRPGSGVVMGQLVKQLPLETFKVITLKTDGKTDDQNYESRVLRVGYRMDWAGKLSMVLRLLYVFILYWRAKKFALDFGPDVVVSPYPEISFLLLGCLVANGINIPFVPYLHDTIAEMTEHSGNRYFTKWVQSIVFKRSRKILVMSEGMRSLYKRKYNLDTVPIVHMYPERIKDFSCLSHNQETFAFWAGSVYGINGHAVKRVFDAVVDCGHDFMFTARMNKASLKRYGVSGDHVVIRKLPSREEYLHVLETAGFAVLALDDCDESRTGAEELATIFPTKTPEYLAAGLPILVHCPKHYFLAQFFIKNKCGIVVEEKSIEELSAAIKFLVSDSPQVMEMRRNAIKMSEMFAPRRVMPKFIETLKSAVL